MLEQALFRIWVLPITGQRGLQSSKTGREPCRNLRTSPSLSCFFFGLFPFNPMVWDWCGLDDGPFLVAIGSSFFFLSPRFPTTEKRDPTMPVAVLLASNGQFGGFTGGPGGLPRPN